MPKAMERSRQDDVALRLMAHARGLRVRGSTSTETSDLVSEGVLRAWRTPAPDGRHEPWLTRIVRAWPRGAADRARAEERLG